MLHFLFVTPRAVIRSGQALAPDFAFHPQIYRADGEKRSNSPGDYQVGYPRPNSRPAEPIRVGPQPTLSSSTGAGIDLTSGVIQRHHIHAAGCMHYEKRPLQGLADDRSAPPGESLNVGTS